MNNYIKSCLKFAQDTKNWLNVDTSVFYRTEWAGDWSESCDGHTKRIASLDITWAFHKNQAEIKSQADIQLLNELQVYIRHCLVDKAMPYVEWVSIAVSLLNNELREANGLKYIPYKEGYAAEDFHKETGEDKLYVLIGLIKYSVDAQNPKVLTSLISFT